LKFSKSSPESSFDISSASDSIDTDVASSLLDASQPILARYSLPSSSGIT